jgi:hypothetical protein
MYTYTDSRPSCSAILPFTPLGIPVDLPFYSPLLTWKPSFGVMRPCPPWSQVACKLTSPISSPPHPLLIPNSWPPWVSPATPRLTKTTSRSRLPGSGTIHAHADNYVRGTSCKKPEQLHREKQHTFKKIYKQAKERIIWIWRNKKRQKQQNRK